jgi:hypothetical protein
MKTLVLLVLLLVTASAAPAQNLTIQVNEGIELMSVIQYLSGHLSNETPSPYREDLKRYFGPYRCHPTVVKMFNFSFRVFPDLVECGLVFSNFPDIRMRPLPDSSSWFKYINRDTLDAYLHMAMRFYRDTHFHAFYLAHVPQYAIWGQGLRDSIGEPIRIFDSLINTRHDRHWLVCMDPLNDWGAHTIEPRNVNLLYDRYFIYQLGYFGDTDRMGHMTFAADLYNFAWHEGTHAFTDSLLRQWAPAIDSLAYLFHESPALTRQNIHDWGHYVNELIPRAVSLALHRQFRSPGDYQALLAAETRNGFVQVEAVSDLIYTDYIHERRVDSFEALLPRILAVLRKAPAAIRN